MPFNLTKLFKAILVCAGTLAGALSYGQSGDSFTKLKTVVIDPGHGGHDSGCISKNGKYKEKNIALSVSLKLGAMIKEKYPQIKVLYTRSTDKFVELGERAAMANRNKADLFISIHVNSTKSSQAAGTETWVMGTHKSESNFELCKAENSVIKLENDYESKYEGFDPNSPESYIIFSLLQNTHLEQSLQLAGHIQKHFKQGPIYANRGVKQGGLIVLWKTTMPAVLVEIGFLSNPKDYNILINKEKHGQIAGRIFNAFQAYKREYESSGKTSPEVSANRILADTGKTGAKNVKTGTGSFEAAAGNNRPAAPARTDAAGEKNSGACFSIQILSVNKILKSNAPDLKGRKDYTYIKVGNLYKYMIGKYATRQEAAKRLPALRKTFPGAFVIQIKDGKIVK